MKHLVTLAKGPFENQECREGFGDGLVDAARENNDVVALTADLKESTKVAEFADTFPDRFIEVGVAEQNLAGIAAGMALSGKVPFMTSFAVFSPGRNWDQIRVSICYSKANVKIIGCHAGLSVGPDGATHQALEDIGSLRSLPNLTIIVPCDYDQTRKATVAIAKHNGPVYMRFGRGKTPNITNSRSDFEIGKAIRLTSGEDVTIIANGPMVAKALEVAKKLEGSYDISVINMHTVKPIDKKAILEAAKDTGAIITVEDHQRIGGLGSAVAEVLSENSPTPLIRLGVNDSFGESGEPEELYDKYGLSEEAIIQAVKDISKIKG